MNPDPIVSIDEETIKDLETFVRSEKFSKFLVSNTTDFIIPVIVLQTLLNKIDDFKNEFKMLKEKVATE